MSLLLELYHQVARFVPSDRLRPSPQSTLELTQHTMLNPTFAAVEIHGHL